MTEHASLFSTIAALATFHPQARALRFWHDARTHTLLSRVELSNTKVPALEQLEVDIALVSNKLVHVVLPDFHGFCKDIEAIFNGAAPNGPVARLDDIDWHRFRRLSAYAQHWQERNPREVSKLMTFIMGIPLYSCLLGEMIGQKNGLAEQAILNQLSQPGSVYLIGVRRFRELFQQQMDMALNEAKMLVATFRGSHDDNAAYIVNGMLDTMLKS